MTNGLDVGAREVVHPLRPIREIANAALVNLSGDFAMLYPPSQVVRRFRQSGLWAMLLQAFLRDQV